MTTRIQHDQSETAGEVILRQANCASTCANQSCGSAGQKGGSLTGPETADIARAGSEADAADVVGGVPEPVVDPEAEEVGVLLSIVASSNRVGVTNCRVGAS